MAESNAKILKEWKRKQVNKIFARNKGACITLEFIMNSSRLLKAVNDMYKQLIECTDIIQESELPEIVVEPIRCKYCNIIIDNFDTTFLFSGKNNCPLCEVDF